MGQIIDTLKNRAEFDRHAKRLQRYGSELMPIVVAETLNRVATLAHIQSIRNMRERMVLRNRYSEGSARFFKASPKKDYRKINAISGHISPYMELADSGGEHKPKSGTKVPIPTLYARGGSKTKVKIFRQKLGQFFNPQFLRAHFVGKPKGRGKNANRPVGIYERTDRNKKTKLTHDLSKPSWHVPRTYWHTAAMRKYGTAENINAVFAQEVEREIKKLTNK